MIVGDKYNQYKNDVIDSYEKERRTEHRGTVLYDAYDKKGIFNKSILITRMELANGLEFSNNFSITSFSLSAVFPMYGHVTSNQKTMAIRVWSGNDHWLLTPESASLYLKIIPYNQTVTQNTMFNIIYWTGTDSELESAIQNGSIMTSGYAFLYHDGTTSSGESTTSSNNCSKKLEDKDLIELDTPNVLFNIPNDTKINVSNDAIVIPQAWEEINYVYLKKKPIHRKYALGNDDLILPLYGGTLTLVFNDGSTFDISTFTKLSYFYTLKELRQYEIPDIINYDLSFDWLATGGGHNERHVPLLIVNPNDTSKKIRVLDGFDTEKEGEIRDTYSVIISSTTMFEPEVEENIKILDYPDNMELHFSDSMISIDGMRVMKTGTKLKYYSAQEGTLYLKNPDIDDTEVCLNNIGSTLEREVYAKDDDDTEEILITTLKFPINEPSAPEIMNISGVTPNNDDLETITDEEVADSFAKAQVSLGCNDVETTTSELGHVSYYSSVTNAKLPRICSPSVKRALRRWRYSRKLPIITRRRYDIPSIGITTIRPYSNSNEVSVSNKGLIAPALRTRVIISSHYVPPLPQKLKEQLKANPNAPRNFAWGLLLKAGVQLLPGIIRGVSGLFKKKRRLTSKRSFQDSIFEENDTEWIDTNVKPLCEDAVISGFDPDSTAATMTVKVQTMGQQQLVTLHDPTVVSINGLIGLRCVKQPNNDEIDYGTENPSEILKDAEFVGVDANNNDQPLPKGHWLGNTPYLSISNGGIVAKSIRWVQGSENGQVDVEVEITAQAVTKYMMSGLFISKHLCNENSPNGLISGFFNLVSRGRKFLSNNPSVAALGKQALSWAGKKVWQKAAPIVATITGNDGENSEKPDEEPDTIIDASVNTALQDTQSTDKAVDDIIRENCAALSFDGQLPKGNKLSVESLQEFFETAKISALNEDDMELNGKPIYVRNYLPPASFVPSPSLAHEIVCNGFATCSWNGISFSIERSSFMKDDPGSYLKMISAPTKTVYTFGDKTVDLDGAIWNLVDSSGNIIIENLTKENVICEPLPQNIEEMVLEIPENENEKTIIEVSFFGYKNSDIRVSLLAPFIVAQNELSKMNSISLHTANSLTSFLSSLAPVALNLISSLFKRNLSTWPGTKVELLRSINAHLVCRDNAGRRKVFNINNMSQTFIVNNYQVTGYNPSSSKSGQEITISCFGYSTKIWISLKEPKYINEVDLDNYFGNITDAITGGATKDKPPEDFEYAPEGEEGKSTSSTDGYIQTLAPIISAGIFKLAMDKILEYKLKIYNTPPSGKDYELAVLGFNWRGLLSTAFSVGKSLLGSLFSNSQGLNDYLKLDTGLRHHRLNTTNGFFKKLWKKVKKVAKKVVKVAKKVVSTVANVAMGVVGNVVSSLAGGALPEPEPEPEPENTILCVPVGIDENGFMKFEPISNSATNDTTIENNIPWRGIRALYSDQYDQLVYVYASLKRSLGGNLHNNPTAVPGIAPYILARRYPEVYESKMGSERSSLNEDTQIDVLDFVNISTYDPSIGILDSSSSITKTLSSFCFSCQELCLGDEWIPLDQLKEKMHIYAQNPDFEWIAIPLNHKSITVNGYSTSFPELEQKIEILYNNISYPIIVHLNSSQKSLALQSDQSFVKMIPHLYLNEVWIAYYFEKRETTEKVIVNEEVNFVGINDKFADTQYLVKCSSNFIESVEEYSEKSSSTRWEEDETNHIIKAYYTRINSDAIPEKTGILLYTFKYTSEIEDYMEARIFSTNDSLYETKDGILLQLNEETGEFVVYGYIDSILKTTATLKKYVLIVEHFSEN